ncbi:MAG: F0F1 ATP synthase subunit B [Bacilli bacterium]|jgi:F-type H+-transporting ATPase subunit b|nr:F0F1 ATP synthase subunit B [Bacilli bacterium]
MELNNLAVLAIDFSGLGDGMDIIGKLVPNLWAFITQLLAFVVMIIIVIKLGYKPVHKFLEARRAYVKENLESAAKQNEEAKIANDEAHTNLVESRKQANDILLAAKKQADADKAQYEADLKDELQMKRVQAEQDIQAERKQAMLQARSEMVDIALAASSTILGREVNDEDNKKYVQQFVDDMANEKTKSK